MKATMNSFSMALILLIVKFPKVAVVHGFGPVVPPTFGILQTLFSRPKSIQKQQPVQPTIEDQVRIEHYQNLL
jgi:hypothetical protein